MFDRSVLFVGSDGIGLGVLAEALAHDHLRKTNSTMPLRVYSATMNETAKTDPILMRAMQRLNLDTSGLSLKPLGLYAFAGAPRVDHVIMLGATLPAATKLALGDSIDVRSWDIDSDPVTETAPGARYVGYLKLAETLQSPVEKLVEELIDMVGVSTANFAHSA